MTRQRRKPPVNTTAPPSLYKDVGRHFYVCDNGHRFHLDYADRNGPNHCYCQADGCGAPSELDYYGPDTLPSGQPVQWVEVPVDSPTLLNPITTTG